MNLADKPCIPCEDQAKLSPGQVADMVELVPEWKLSEEGTAISRSFAFKDFGEALAFANRVGELAQEAWHHPDLAVSWGKVTVSFSTHSVGGLSHNDFIMAAKVDALLLD